MEPQRNEMGLRSLDRLGCGSLVAQEQDNPGYIIWPFPASFLLLILATEIPSPTGLFLHPSWFYLLSSQVLVVPQPCCPQPRSFSDSAEGKP